MGKTGGGRGTNQHQIKGRSLARETGRVPPRPEAGDVTLPKTYHAVDPGEVRLARVDPSVIASLSQGTSERAAARYVARRAEFAFSSAYLEGNTFTLPEVYSLLDGVMPHGKTEEEVDQVTNLAEASELLVDMVREGTFTLDLQTSDQLHALLARNEALAAGKRRHFSEINHDGRGAHVNVMGDHFHGYTHEQLAEVDTVLLERVRELEHPVERAINYAAFASYTQMYLDVNKRTARYVMDGELMRHGYDAIAVPASRKDEYHQALARTFRTGDLQPYADFLLDVALHS